MSAVQVAWIYLLIAGLFEIVWAIGLKYTEGWSRLWPSIGTLAAMAASVIFLSLAMKALPVETPESPQRALPVNDPPLKALPVEDD